MSVQNKQVDPKAQIKYHPHDMSCQLKFTSSVGQLLPVYWDFLNPGDKIEITPSMFSRLQQMTSPAFTRLTEHIDFFAVPMNQLFSPFEAIFYGVKDFRSDFYTSFNFIPRYPQVNLQDMISAPVEDDMFRVPRRQNATRLCDLLGYGSYVPTSSAVTRVNPIMAQAYQKIYQDFYRLSDREEKDVNSYNVDSLYATSVIDVARSYKFLTMRYRPWKKDFFTNVQCQPLADGHNTIGMLIGFAAGSADIPKWLNDTLSFGTGNPENNYSEAYGGPVTDVISNVGESLPSSQTISVQQLKQMFSFYKLVQTTAKAGKTIDKQQLAHWGVKMPKGADGEVIYLGSSHGVIQVDSVVNQADDLGQLGGKAQGQVNGRKVSYTADQHTVIMAIYSCVPEADYSSVGLNRFHTYQYPNDFPKPELEQLGLQPMFNYEADYNVAPSERGDIIGWTEKWRELKQKYDRSSGGLQTNWSNWITQRIVNGNELKEFLIPPNFLDSIMSVEFGTGNDDVNPWASDPLIHALHFDSRKLSKMSVETDSVGLT